MRGCWFRKKVLEEEARARRKWSLVVPSGDYVIRETPSH